MNRNPNKHGFARRGLETPEYRAWKEAKKRCYYSGHKDYASYGGRGIVMEDLWIDDPARFVADMGPKPTPKHSLERLDNEGPYSPTNCVWATQKEQRNNQRKHRVKPGKSGHNGIHITVAGTYRVQVKQQKLGTYKTLEEALKERKLHE